MKYNKKSIYFCILILIMLFAVSQASATEAVDNVTLDNSAEVVAVEEIDGGLDDDVSDVVADSGDEDVLGDTGTFTNLNNEIEDADNYDTIELDRDYAYSNGDSDFEEGIIINKDLIIEGNGHTIYGNGARTFIINEGCAVMINNLTFVGTGENTFFSEGAVIFNRGSLLINNSVFSDNCLLYQGGAIFSNGQSDLTIQNCEFYNNHADGDDDRPGNGGAIASYGYLYIHDSFFDNCTASFGGAIATFKEAKIFNSVFGNVDDSETGNTAYGCGGAIFNCYETDEGESQPICYAVNCQFDYNTAYYKGGALYNVIAIKSLFGSDNLVFEDDETGETYGHNMYIGLNYECDETDSYDNNYYDTIMSDGFEFTAVSLIVDPTDCTFWVLVTSTPDGEPVPGLDVYMVVNPDADYEGLYIDTDLYVDEDNWVFNVTDVDGIVGFPLNGLSQGDYEIEVGLMSKDLDFPYETFKVHLGLIASSVSGTNIIFNEGGHGSTVLTLNGATVSRPNVYVVGQPAANIQVSGNVITVSNLAAGTYYLSVKTTPNYGYSASSCMIPIYVNKVYYPPVVYPSSYKAPSTSGSSKKTVTFKVKKVFGNLRKCTGLFITPKVNGKAVKGLKFKIQIYTNGKVVRTVTIKSVKKIYGKKNTAFYSTNALSKGTHKVKISISTSKYKGSKTTSIIVKKQGSFTNNNGHAKGR